jgi:hypothetical protein
MPETGADTHILAACDMLLREIAGYPITPERMDAALPLVREMLRAIRILDEVDLGVIEPMTIFRPLP